MVWIPLLKCRRRLILGRRFQPPPVVCSLEAKKGGLDVTLLDRCMEYKETVELADAITAG